MPDARPPTLSVQLGPHKVGSLLVAEYMRSVETNGRQAPGVDVLRMRVWVGTGRVHAVCGDKRQAGIRCGCALDASVGGH